MSSFKSVPIDSIKVGDGRRPINQNWVNIKAESIAEEGLINPITIRPVEGGYKLVTGGHRLAAFVQLEHETIPAIIRPYVDGKDANYYKLEEISENIVRHELTALDRAQAFHDLDTIYKDQYPKLKRGGNKQTVDARQNLTAIMAVRFELMEKVGISERSFQRSIAIWKGLSLAARARVNGTWLADHQAGLMQLAAVGPKEQVLVLDILFAEKPKATSVADALIIVHGKRLVPANEKRIKSTQGNLEAMNRNERISVLSCFEDEIREIAKMKGWV